MGFQAAKDWRIKIGSNIVANFFHALDKGILSVIIEPDDNTDILEINSKSLSKFLENISFDDNLDEEEKDNPLYLARQFRDLYHNNYNLKEKQDTDLGHCKLWIKVADGLPKKVGFIRKSGMLITTKQSKLERFPGYNDFIALCIFEDPDGNELLRRMENPKHDQFEYELLPKSDRERGKKALSRITDWIREAIKEVAGPSAGSSTTVLSELSTLLPDMHPDDEFDHYQDDEENDKERGFGDRVRIQLKPHRSSSNPSLEEEENQELEGDGDDQGSEGGEGVENGGGGDNPDGPGEGDGQVGSGTRGGGRGTETIRLSNIRILPCEIENHYQLIFTAENSATANLQIREAGDSSSMPQDYIKVADGFSLEGVILEKGKRNSIEIISAEPLNHRALHLTANEEIKDEI